VTLSDFYSQFVSQKISGLGVDVIVTIFGEKMAFFSKTNLMIKFLQKVAAV
jgi:hypothetical protein